MKLRSAMISSVMIGLLLAGSGCKILDIGKKIPWPKPKPSPEQPSVTSDELLAIIESSSEFSEKRPDRVNVRFDFDGGEFIEFQIQNTGDAWVGGQVKKTDGTMAGLNSNLQLRHRALAVMGEQNARQLGGNQLRRGDPPMPIIDIESSYHWQTDSEDPNGRGKTMYEVNNANVYAIRVVNLLKEELGVTGKMTAASGKVLSYVKD